MLGGKLDNETWRRAWRAAGCAKCQDFRGCTACPYSYTLTELPDNDPLNTCQVGRACGELVKASWWPLLLRELAPPLALLVAFAPGSVWKRGVPVVLTHSWFALALHASKAAARQLLPVVLG